MFKKILKYFIYIVTSVITLVTISVAGYFGYVKYQQNIELTYKAASKCVMHQYDTQLCEPIDDSRRSFLRRVDLDTGEIVISRIGDDPEQKYRYQVFWPARCQPGDEIETNIQLRNGQASFHCVNESSFFSTEGESYLSLSLQANARSNLDFSYGGFSVSERFAYTDYSPLEREVTLDSAKSAEQIALEEEVAREEERLKNIALEKERADAEERERQRVADEARQAEIERERQAEINKMTEEFQACDLRNQKYLEETRQEMISLIESNMTLECTRKMGFEGEGCISGRYQIRNSTPFTLSGLQFSTSNFIGAECPISEPSTYVISEIPAGDTFNSSDYQYMSYDPRRTGCVRVLRVELKGIEAGLEACQAPISPPPRP
jgi:hypothetical protein